MSPPQEWGIVRTRCGGGGGRGTLDRIYFALIHSYINYTNIAWASSCKTGLKKILLKQKHAVRIVFHEDRLTHARPLLKSLNALNVYQVNLYQICLFMYQVKNGTIPKNFNNNFSTVDHSYPTRFALNSFYHEDQNYGTSF